MRPSFVTRLTGIVSVSFKPGSSCRGLLIPALGKLVIDTTGTYHSSGAGETLPFKVRVVTLTETNFNVTVEDLTSTDHQRRPFILQPLNRNYSERTKLFSSELQSMELPLQLQSDTKLVVKVLSTSAPEGAADLIGRSPGEQERDTLEPWKMVRVEFNAQGPQAASLEATDEEGVEKPRKHSIVHWQDEVLSQDSQMSWEDPPTPFAYMEDEVPSIWETWDIDTKTGDNTANLLHSDDMCEDNISLVSHESLPYSVDKFGTAADAGLFPWGTGFVQKISPIKYHMELVYPLNVLDTCLSSNKGTAQMHSLIKKEMDKALDLYRALESTENDILHVNWKEYVQDQERVSRWREERRMTVRNYNQDVAVMLAAGFTREEVPARKALVTWEEWLTEIEEKEEQAENSGDEEMSVGIMVFKPLQRRMAQGGRGKEIQTNVEPLAMGMSSTGVAEWIDSHIVPQSARWDGFTG